MEDYLLTEKYRPQAIQDLVLPDRIRKQVERGFFGNLIFHGTQGTGKTSTVRAMVKEFDVACFELNASREARISVIDEIQQFAASQALDPDKRNKTKVVFLDEAEKSSPSFFDALRNSIERYANTTRFVMTTNYLSKIPDPIRSRFHVVSFDYSEEERLPLIKSQIRRIFQICKAEGIEFEKEGVMDLVKAYLPDMRAMLNALEGVKAMGEKVTAGIGSRYYGMHGELFDLVLDAQAAPESNYQMIIGRYADRVEQSLAALGREFLDYLQKERPDCNKHISKLAIAVNNHQCMLDQALDEPMVLLSCVYTMQSIVSGATHS